MVSPGRGSNSDKAKSPLPFALCLALCLFIVADKFSLFRGGEETAKHVPCAAAMQKAPRKQVEAPAQTESHPVAAPSRRASGGGGKKHHAILFLFEAIIIGTFIAHLLTLHIFHGLQQTVVIFVVGVVYSLFLEGLHWNDGLGIFGDSYDMWMEIDPHLLLFTLLPPLLAGDAMSMDTAIARRVHKQWLYLAGPGVLINGFLTALFLYLYLPYNWDFLLCLVTGAILCATDPVAVVALLKELGAPPTLTVQIQGESLLNDGTAIVLFQLSHRMLEGEKFDLSEIIVFMMKTAACAWLLGLCVGWFFYLWITAASSKIEDHSSVIQIALSLCSAYWSYVIAEGIFKISGVLATVAASLVLADKMWPVLVSKESMHTFWEMMEFLGNIVVFFLAGTLTGKMMVRMPFWDYLHLIVIYVVLMLIRGGMLIASRPVMNYFGRQSSPPQYVSVADALVMTWGGLRGAVGLALAIQVTIERAGGKISQMDADRVLFYVSGVAALTLMINATSCPKLVKTLGITALPATKKRVLVMIQEQLMTLLETRMNKGGVSGKAAVAEIKCTLGEIRQWIDLQGTKKDSVLSDGFPDDYSDLATNKTSIFTRPSEGEHDPEQTEVIESSAFCLREQRAVMESERSGEESDSQGSDDTDRAERNGTKSEAGKSDTAREVKKASTIGGKSNATGATVTSLLTVRQTVTSTHRAMRRTVKTVIKRLTEHRHMNLRDYDEICQQLNEVKNKFGTINEGHLALLGDLPSMPSEEEQHQICQLIKNEDYSDANMVQAMNEVFLNLVNSQYWKLIDAGDMVPGTNEAEVLLSSIKLAKSHHKAVLNDFEYVCVAMYEQVHRLTGGNSSHNLANDDLDRFGRPSYVSWHSTHRVSRFVESPFFNAMIMLAIVSNAVFIGMEDGFQNQNNEADLGWLIADLTFSFIFIIEFLLKFWGLRCKYFRDNWNCLDFFLVLLSIGSNVLSIVADVSTDVSSESRLIRVARILRVMRLMKLFRLLSLFRVVKAKLMRLEFSAEVAKHFQTITVLSCFIKAHMNSHREMWVFFGNDNKVDMPELARVVIDSQVQAYKAMSLAADSVQCLNRAMLEEATIMKKSTELAEHLNHIVLDARKHGVVTSREAESVLHPIRTHLKDMQTRIRQKHFGYVKHSGSSRPSHLSSASNSAPVIEDTADQSPGDHVPPERKESQKSKQVQVEDAMIGIVPSSSQPPAFNQADPPIPGGRSCASLQEEGSGLTPIPCGSSLARSGSGVGSYFIVPPSPAHHFGRASTHEAFAVGAFSSSSNEPFEPVMSPTTQNFSNMEEGADTVGKSSVAHNPDEMGIGVLGKIESLHIQDA